MREVTNLACPSKHIPGQPRAASELMMSGTTKSGGTNQMRTKFDRSLMNQSPRDNNEDQVNEDSPLEETN